MQALTHDTFPAQFVLYMPSRSSSKDPYSGFILMNSELVAGGETTNTYRQLIRAAYSPVIMEFENNPFDSTCYPGKSRQLNFKGDTTEAATFHSARPWNIIVRFTGSSVLVPVIEITKINKQFKHMLRRTVVFRLSAAATAAAVAAQAAAASSTPVMSPSTSVIAHIPATPAPIKKKKSAYVTPTSSGTICLHVARQLMELAQIKKEMCPIIAEEYTAGETAIMPCGHLFSKLAIQESFKKEVNKCPACRQNGHPTFV